MGPAGLEIGQLLGGDIGVDSRELGMEVSMTTLRENWSAGFRGRSNELESRDAGRTLCPLHSVTVGSKSPALLGLSLVIHKMGLIIHCLPYKMVGKMNEIERKRFSFLGNSEQTSK